NELNPSCIKSSEKLYNNNICDKSGRFLIVVAYNGSRYRIGVKETKNIRMVLAENREEITKNEEKSPINLKIHWTETELCQQNV
ncbi:hypothetical protein Bhyg_12082, partial [Pseudolycoriella hygida]